MRENKRAFEEMRRVAVGWLAGREPEDIARRAGIVYDAARAEFQLTSLGRELRLRWPECELAGECGNWHELLLLHYLHRAEGTPLSQRIITFAELRDGMVRGGGFDRDSAARLSHLLDAFGPPAVTRACAALGAEFTASNADLCAVFALFPRFPMTLKWWFADDEFPASARLLLNAAADHYLTIEDAVTAGEVLLAELEAQLNRPQA